MNRSQCKVSAKASEQSCVSVWRSAGFSAPSGLSLPKAVSPLVTWELLERISVCLTATKQGRRAGSCAPGSSAPQNNRAGHASSLTLQYECHCVLFPSGPTSNPNRGNVHSNIREMSSLAGLFSQSCFLFSMPFLPLICLFFFPPPRSFPPLFLITPPLSFPLS